MSGAWYSDAFDAWTRFWWPQHRTFFVWGCWPFLLIAGFWIFAKLVIWAAGIAAMAVVAIIMATIGLFVHERGAHRY